MPRSSPSWDTNSSPVSQETHHILQNPNVYYQVYNSHTLVPIPSKMNSFHNALSDLSNLHFPIPSHLCPYLPCGIFLSGFPTSMCQMPYLPHPPSFNHALPTSLSFIQSCPTYLPHPPSFNLLNSIRWEAETTKLFIMQFSPFPCYFLPFMPKPEHPFIFIHLSYIWHFQQLRLQSVTWCGCVNWI